jgi:hypothetical protein
VSSNDESDLRKKAERFFSSEIIAALIAILTILSGLEIALWTKEIQDSMLAPFWKGEFDGKSTVFWLQVLLIGLLFWQSLVAQSRKAQRAAHALQVGVSETKSTSEALKIQIEEIQKVATRIESLPPESFLSDYKEITRRAMRSAMLAIASRGGHLQEVDDAIRNVLGAILSLALKYDRQRSGAIYSANIMLLREDWILETKTPFSFRDLTFSKGNPAFPRALELIPSLSTSSESDRFEPEKDLKALVIPIPKEVAPVLDSQKRQRYPVLPGAPWSFVYREFASFPTIALLSQWLDERSSASEEDRAAIREHFEKGAGSAIKSFVSMPIDDSAPSGETPPVLGVLNIHSSSVDILGVKGSERFAPLVEPLLGCLTVLINLRFDVQSQAVTAGEAHGTIAGQDAGREDASRSAAR